MKIFYIIYTFVMALWIVSIKNRLYIEYQKQTKENNFGRIFFCDIIETALNILMFALAFLFYYFMGK